MSTQVATSVPDDSGPARAAPETDLAGRRRIVGIALMCGAVAFFASLDACGKTLARAGVDPLVTTFMRYAASVAMISLFINPVRTPGVVKSRRLPLQIARSLLLFASTALNFLALRYLQLAETISIQFAAPLTVALLAGPLLGEWSSRARLAAIGVGFLGVLVIVRPGTEAFHPAVLLSLGTAVFSALYNLLTRKLAGVDSTGTQQFYAAGVATICIAPFSIGGWVWPHDIGGWLPFIIIGIAALIGHLFITTAHRYAPASVLAPFGYLQIIFMTGSSWLVFNQPPDMWIFIGAPIVMASGFYIWLRERQLSKSLITEVTVED